jgi:membrane-bound inhibitor of C-type lysozyme
MIRRHAAALLVLLPEAAAAGIKTDSWHYACDRGVQIAVTYVSDEDSAAVVLQVEGRQIALLAESDRTADVARFGWPSDGAGYVWLSGISDGTLLWKEAGQETVLLTCGAMQ